MALPRFYVPGPWTADGPIDLPDDTGHHALRVLRLTAGTAIEVFDGAGMALAGVLVVRGRQAVMEPRGDVRHTPARSPRLTLVQGIASGDKMDWIVEKATELGVDRVVPLAARRSVLRLQGDRREKRWQHWQRVAQAACAQCGRDVLPEIQPPLTMSEWLARPAAPGLALTCHPEAEPSLLPLLRRESPEALTLWVGPEGGWDDEELALAQRHGIVPVRLGGHVLRTETAGLALAAACSAVLGWSD